MRSCIRPWGASIYRWETKPTKKGPRSTPNNRSFKWGTVVESFQYRLNWYPGNDVPGIGPANSSHPNVASPSWSPFYPVSSPWCADPCFFDQWALDPPLFNITSPHVHHTKQYWLYWPMRVSVISIYTKVSIPQIDILHLSHRDPWWEQVIPGLFSHNLTIDG